MAREVYRIEIPIEVDDRTAQALQQAGVRLTKFEKSVDRTEKRLQKVSRTKWQLTLYAIDRATRTILHVGATALRVTGRTYRITVRVLDYATRPLRMIGGLLSSVFSSTLGLLGVGAAGFGGVVWPIRLADEMETTRIGFETMLKNAKEAEKFIAEIQDFAKRTPFGLQEVVELGKALLVRGFDRKEVLPMLETIGDLTAAMGTGAEGIDRIIYALGQMKALGKVSAEEMNQLTEAGVRAWDYLAKGMGKSIAEVRKLSEQGKIKADEAIKHIMNGMKEYAGMMENASNRTVSGLLGRLQDVLKTNVFLRWGQGIQSVLVPALQYVNNWFNENAQAVERWGDSLESIARGAAQWIVDAFKNAFEHVRVNYLENPEFQELSFPAKVWFVFSDVYQQLLDWWNSTGEPAFENWWENTGKSWFVQTGKNMLWAIYEGAKTVAPTVIKTIGRDILNGISWTIEKAFGINLPGGRSGKEILQEKIDIANSARRMIRGYATGGIVTQPQLATVAESGPEAIIPLTGNRTRAIALWQEAGRQLGATQTVNNNNRNVVININVEHMEVHNEADLNAYMHIMARKMSEALGNLPI